MARWSKVSHETRRGARPEKLRTLIPRPNPHGSLSSGAARDRPENGDGHPADEAFPTTVGLPGCEPVPIFPASDRMAHGNRRPSRRSGGGNGDWLRSAAEVPAQKIAGDRSQWFVCAYFHGFGCRQHGCMKTVPLSSGAARDRAEDGDGHPSDAAFPGTVGLPGREPVPIFLRRAQRNGAPL